jgi:hypothetical protein
LVVQAADVILNLVFLVLGTVLGSIGGVFYGAYMQQPKLRLSGMGNGESGSKGVRHFVVSLSNDAHFVGLRTPELRTRSKILVKQHLFGHTFRRDAVQAIASIRRASGVGGGQGLYVSSPGVDYQPRDKTTVNGGESLSVWLFVTDDRYPGKYFLYQPKSPQDYAAQVPSPEKMLDGEGDYIVHVSYLDDHRSVEFSIFVRKHLNGALYMETDTGGMLMQ